jgi:DNA-binding NtrC family response regulator
VDVAAPDRTREHEDARRVVVARFRAEVVRGPRADPFVGALAAVGSAADCDLVIPEATVSRYHAELAADAGGVRVRDLGSTNGISAHGARIHEAIVPSGTVLELGATAVRVSDAEATFEPFVAPERLGDLVARAPAMRKLIERVQRAAGGDASVLVTGEGGTGKELVARTIHDESPRRAGPFVVVDCGSLVGPLVASELFGHEKGAFTDAESRRLGAFERARGGTLLLDDVSALPLEVQPMLLGALERRRSLRVGGRTEVEYDLRIVACSSRDLRLDVNAGRFRLDLYYRLAVVRLDVPPLRERLDDLPELVALFLEERGHGPSHPLASPGQLADLAARPWPGNVRELRNAIDAALALEEPLSAAEGGEPSDAIASTEAWMASLTELPYKEARARFVAALEHAYFEDLARRSRGNVSAAARLAQLDRSQLRQLLARAKIAIKPG